MSYTALHDPSGRFVGVTRDGLQIPADPANGDWREFLAWNDLAPEPVSLADLDPPTPVELLARVRAEALSTLLTAGTVRAIQVRAMLVTMQFLTNNLLEFLFQRVADLEGKTREQLVAELTAQFPTNTGPRALDVEAFAYLMANPTAGDPAPTE